MIHSDIIQMFKISPVYLCYEASYGQEHFYLCASEANYRDGEFQPSYDPLNGYQQEGISSVKASST